MERIYQAWEVSFEGTRKRQAKRPEISGVDQIESRQRLSSLLEDEPERIMLELAMQAPPTLDLYEGYLSEAPRDTTFVVEGEQTDIDRIKAAANPLEFTTMMELGPPKKLWRATIAWSDGAQGWRIA